MKPNQPPSLETLTLEQTRLTANSTLMDSIQTSISLSSFGFTIFKVFQYAHDSKLLSPGWEPRGPKHLGLLLITLGSITLGIAIIEYAVCLTRLGVKKVFTSSAMLGAILVLLVGIFLFVNILIPGLPFMP